MWFCLLSQFVFAKENVCPSGTYRVKSHYRSGYVRSDGTVVRPTRVKTYCKRMTRAHEYLAPLFKEGVPPNWPHQMEKKSIWTESEEERLEDSMEEIPDVLLSPQINGFYRLHKSKDYPNPASRIDGAIVVYDSAFDRSRNLSRIIAHELAHQNFDDLSIAERQDYRRVAGWRAKLELDRTVYWVGRSDGYVEEDGKTSFEEDYANNVEYYLYNSDKLKKMTPKVYEWMQQHFGNSLQLKGKK